MNSHKGFQLPNLLAGSNIAALPTEDNCHRKVNLNDIAKHATTKDRLAKLCTEYTDIFSKHPTGIGKTDLSQMTLTPKDNKRPLDQKPYIFPLNTMPGLRKELNDLEKAGIISPSTSNLHSLSS